MVSEKALKKKTTRVSACISNTFRDVKTNEVIEISATGNNIAIRSKVMIVFTNKLYPNSC